MMSSADPSPGDSLAMVLAYYGLIDVISSDREKVVCPFHADENPSMAIDFESGRFYCFGCGASGDALDFVRRMERQERGANDLASLRLYRAILSGRATGGPVPSLKGLRKAHRPSQRASYDVAYDTYHGLRSVDWLDPRDGEESDALAYMEGRGFDASTLNLAEAKVTYRRNYGLIFPMRDNGRFRGWVCRTMVPEVERKRKYLYNKGFSRATTLVGNYGPKRLSGIDAEVAIVVEGYMDRLKFVQYGAFNAVAILGWKMTREQVQKLRESGVKVVVSALDNDDCGRKGTRFLRTQFPHVVRWKYLRGLKDPGDMTREQYERMAKRTMKEVREILEKGYCK